MPVVLIMAQYYSDICGEMPDWQPDAAFVTLLPLTGLVQTLISIQGSQAMFSSCFLCHQDLGGDDGVCLKSFPPS